MNNFPILYSQSKHGVLCIDPSASHLAWTLITLDFDAKELYISSVGMLWTSAKWTKGQRYKYMQAAIGVLSEGDGEVVPHVALTEGFFVNPKMMMGSAVVPTINAFIEMAADTASIGYYEMGPSTWRGILGIKAVKDAAGKRDYKVPTAQLVAKYLTVPEEIQSNINRKNRQLPNDITDVLALAIALGRHHGITKVSVGNAAFLPFAILEKLTKEAEKINASH